MGHRWREPNPAGTSSVRWCAPPPRRETLPLCRTLGHRERTCPFVLRNRPRKPKRTGQYAATAAPTRCAPSNAPFWDCEPKGGAPQDPRLLRRIANGVAPRNDYEGGYLREGQLDGAFRGSPTTFALGPGFRRGDGGGYSVPSLGGKRRSNSGSPWSILRSGSRRVQTVSFQPTPLALRSAPMASEIFPTEQ